MASVAKQRWVGILGLTLALLTAIPAQAGELRLPEVQARVGTLVARWEDADRALSQTRSEQATLEHRIAALKRLETSRSLSAANELETLLRDSIRADQALQVQLTTEADRRRAAIDGIKDAVTRIDAELRRLVPGLRRGTLAERTQAARTLTALKDARDGLKTELSSLKDPERAQQAWARYDVAIEPLDGPSELNEKADFVEDTRDKIQEKRRALSELIREAREEQQLAQAARDFATDVTLFDEESRSGRVQRRNGTPNAVTLADRGADQSSGQPETGGTTPPVAAETPSPAPASRDDPNAFNNDGTGVVATPTEPNKQTTSPPPTAAPPVVTAVGAPASAFAKDMNPSVLLSLRIEELAAKGVDLATLERLVAQLQQLDGHLARRATQIRARAKQLEVDEARARSKLR